MKIKIILIILFLFFQILISHFALQNASINYARQNLAYLIQRVGNDLEFSGDKWDTKRYLADPLTPHPSGSSGFNKTLYIITTDGFVIERNLPVNGYLDSSDFKHLLKFTTPETVDFVTNEKWRILTKPILKDGEVLGVITASFYNPETSDITLIDNSLNENIRLLESEVYVENNNINTSKIDVRNINYNISFEIVDKYNRVLLNNGRTPSFIDPSYVQSEFKNGDQVVTDKVNSVKYIAKKQVIRNSSNQPVGIIIAAEKIDIADNLFNEFITTYLLLEIALIAFIIVFYNSRKALTKIDILKNNIVSKTPKSIIFDKKNLNINIDGEKIDIPYSSNQYYLCDAVFSYPKKIWAIDELLSKFGEEPESKNWRKIYDTVITTNKKCGLKLIVFKNKSIYFNPQLLKSLNQQPS